MFKNVYKDKLNIISASQLLGSDSNSTVKVKAIGNVYNYRDNQKTEEVIGKRLTVLCPDGKSLSVKLSNEVSDLNEIQTGMRIRLYNLTGKIYCSNNKLALTVNAEGWEQIND